MPYVKLRYGPYKAHGIIKHRIQRLHGLIRCLSEKGYQIEILPSEHLNRLTVEMGGSVIFQCDIRNLLFNMECEDDPVCQRVVDGIQEAATRIYSQTNIPTFVSIKEGKRYLERCKNLTTRDYFSASVELLYEHQEHLRGDILKQVEHAEKVESKKQLSLQDPSREEVSEDEYFDTYDEYADWDYATNIIRGILDTIPMVSDVDVTVGDDCSEFAKNLSYAVLDHSHSPIN